ncbi:MAG: hypothetical protein GC156_12305 [Actinomycetales bacterium]|nr:hypothetical protein [Actinomycetales bacterium]
MSDQVMSRPTVSAEDMRDSGVRGWRLLRARARLADTMVAAGATAIAATSIIPLFADLSWVAPVLVVIVVIAAAGALGRAVALPMPLIPIVEALALLFVITAMFAWSTAWAGFVPTTDAWDAILALVRQGMQDAEAYGSPAPALTGMVLLTVGGVGAVALSVDTLFVCVRSPILAGLPLAALFLAPAMINASGPPWWALPVAGIGWLLVLAADQRERVQSWGSLASEDRVRGLSASARRVGAVTLLIAGVLAVVVPAGAWAPWRTVTGDGPGVAVGTADEAIVLDPLATMRRDLIQSNNSEVLTYRTSAKQPDYLRVSALETFDGTTWLPRAALSEGRYLGTPIPSNVLSDRIAADPSNRVTGGESVSYDISVTNLQNAFLPLPYPISDVEDIKGLGADWSLDPTTGIAFSNEVPASGLEYRVAALDPRIGPNELRQAPAASGGLWPQLALPSGLPPVIAQTAREVTAQANTPYDRAIALQRWFTHDGGFTYSTGVRSGADSDYLAEFLRDKVGYCEQFAGAMAVMARSLGIPSRVVVGFTQGSLVGDGEWRVTVRDAHAWPELWFDGIGWVRFEPTPRSQGTLQTPDYAPTADVPVNDGPRVPRGLDPQAVPLAGDSAAPTWRSVALALLGIVVVLAALALLTWFAAPAVVRRVRRYRRLHASTYPDIVEGAWAEIADTAVDHGQHWDGTSTPRQAAGRLGRAMPEAPRAALERVRRELERVRYGRPETVGTAPRLGAQPVAEHAEAVRDDVRQVAREFGRRVRWQTRVIAYCWPPSERRRQQASLRRPTRAPAENTSPRVEPLPGSNLQI